jgi:hypothetical protein
MSFRAITIRRLFRNLLFSANTVYSRRAKSASSSVNDTDETTAEFRSQTRLTEFQRPSKNPFQANQRCDEHFER